MNRFNRFVVSLLLSLALCGQALAAEVVNINTADAKTLDAVLVNVGPAKAQAIVDYRRENGAFKSVEQLAMVKGIGLKTVEKNRERLSVGSGRAMVPVARAGATQRGSVAASAKTPAKAPRR